MSSDFYRNRILWCAGKHRLLDKRCVLYGLASGDQKAAIAQVLDDADGGVLLFWDTSTRWTLLTDAYVASWHGGALHRSELDRIEGAVSAPSLAGDVESSAKLQAEWLLLDKPGVLIWAPAGKELFALWSILKMFPLKTGDGEDLAVG